MRNWNEEFDKRTKWIEAVMTSAHAGGAVFGNSGGKDSALVGILCKAATEKSSLKTVGVIMPCQSKVNYGTDKTHAEILAKQFGIETVEVDLTAVKEAFEKVLLLTNRAANTNINPRLRMTALYALGQEKGLLVAGTDNLSERTMGYFTKFGDGACDFNPVGDLTASEVLDFLRYLDAPKEIVEKAPSAGLWEGQTDEEEMGILYKDLDGYLLTNKGGDTVKQKVERAKQGSEHKRRLPLIYPMTE
jgi:NAD+ synthase